MVLFKINMRRIFETLLDIGFKRIILRIKYELKISSDKIFYRKNIYYFFKKIVNINKKFPTWNNKIICIKKNNSIDSPKNENLKIRKISFNFLLINKLEKFYFPFLWNDSKKDRLWQFHLHYFNWLRNWIEKDINSFHNSVDINLIVHLIDEWINLNHKSSFDGWHSYTTSIRIRNWILFFSLYEDRLKMKYLNSIWEQIIWLNGHPEDCHGGNHWIENITALIFGCLFFNSKKSEIIYEKSLNILKKELENQILQDGGHEERSASYHILVLDRLVETTCLIYIYKKQEVEWLEKVIIKMLIWLERVRSDYKILPRFNDNLFQQPQVVDEIMRFALSFINKSNYCKKGIRYQLIESCNFEIAKSTIKLNFAKKYRGIIDLPDSGLMIIKPNKDWFLSFKCGQSCPNSLPAHVHSDLLSFDIFYRDSPLLSGSGTSTYQKGNIRNFERSTISSNCLQLGSLGFESGNEKKSWIEPVEVWSAFRAGRKAKTTIRNCGINSDGSFWVFGGHDGFKIINASYERKIIFFQESKYKVNVKIIDYLNLGKKTAWRTFWHLAPGQKEAILLPMIKDFSNRYDCKYRWEKTHFAVNFNERISRKSLIIEGILNPGKYEFENYISFDSEKNKREVFDIFNKDEIIVGY